MESILRAKCRTYTVGLSENKTGSGKTFYALQVTYVLNDGQPGYFSMDGESFPDMFSKIADRLSA
jgi:hypothetical protein